MNPGIIIQARLGSSRFPAKIAASINANQNILEFIATPLSRLKWPAVIALPDTPEHHAFADSLRIHDVNFFFGEEENVLTRFIQAARHFDFTTVARVCGDNPCLNISFLKHLMVQWNENYDYLAWFDSAGTPGTKTHYGLFSEIAKVSALERIKRSTAEKYYTEHVTPYFYEHPDEFVIRKVSMPEPFWSGTPLRFTVDTLADFEIMKNIVAHVDVQDIHSLVKFSDQELIRAAMQKEIMQNSK